MIGTEAFFHAMAPALTANLLTVTLVYCFAKIAQKEQRSDEDGVGTYIWLVAMCLCSCSTASTPGVSGRIRGFAASIAPQIVAIQLPHVLPAGATKNFRSGTEDVLSESHSEDTEFRCFDGTGGGSGNDGSLNGSSSLRLCG